MTSLAPRLGVRLPGGKVIFLGFFGPASGLLLATARDPKGSLHLLVGIIFYSTLSAAIVDVMVGSATRIRRTLASNKP